MAWLNASDGSQFPAFPWVAYVLGGMTLAGHAANTHAANSWRGIDAHTVAWRRADRNVAEASSLRFSCS